MKFKPCAWRWDNLRGWSPQRIAAARKALEKELQRVESLRMEVALFPDLQQQIVPSFHSVEERRTEIDQREIALTRGFRSERAAGWREARRLYFAMPSVRRQGFRRLWNRGIYPHDPAYCIETIRTYSRPGNSPWTYLRKLRLIVLWNSGRIERPSCHLAILATLTSINHSRAARQRDYVRRIRRRIRAGVQFYL